MSCLLVEGGSPLSGEITPSGNKNAALPILCASLLTKEKVTLRNVPNITDIEKLVDFFRSLGSTVNWMRGDQVMILEHKDLLWNDRIELPQGMRSSVLLLAPLLYRLKKIQINSNTKGCALGIREIDPHLEILQHFGVKVEGEDPIVLTLDDSFSGQRMWMDYMSVTATENFVMAAALAQGASTIINAASEPHVQDLCHFLQDMGALIRGMGSSVLRIEGVDELKGVEARISSDHHEIVTFLAIGAITGGEVKVKEAEPERLDLIVRAFDKMNVEIKFDGDTAIVPANQDLKIRKPYTSNMLSKIEAAPWPYFPVDLLPPMVALATKARGNIHFWNKVYEGGFSWIPELVKFGAHIVISDPHRVVVFGDSPLRPAKVEAPYIIRAAVALYMVAASIPGQSTIQNADSIKRAHPNFVENLQSLGAKVEWS